MTGDEGVTTDPARPPATAALEFDGRYRVDSFELDMRFSVEPGEFVALVGPNGSGKSTVLRLIAGLMALDGGSIAIGGQVVDDAATGTIVAAERRRAGLVFQKPLLFAHLNVRDNVAYGLRSAGASKKESRQAADAWLRDLDIGALADRRPDQLSGGQAQRVAFTRALAPEPPLLLLDEPFSALDPGAAVAVRSWLADQLARTSTSTIAVLHEEAAVRQLADRAVAIDAGRVTFGPATLPAPAALLSLMGGPTHH